MSILENMMRYISFLEFWITGVNFLFYILPFLYAVYFVVS
jgi:hypothetical protein